MENKGGFHEHLCPRECLPHPSAVSNKPGYFQVWVCFFIEEQAAECERNVLSKRQWPQLCLKWDSRPEESFHTSRQKKEQKKKVLTTVRACVCVRARPPPLPQPATTTWPQRWLTLCVDTRTETLKSKQLHEDFLSLCCRTETLNASQSRLRVCWHRSKPSYSVN